VPAHVTPDDATERTTHVAAVQPAFYATHRAADDATNDAAVVTPLGAAVATAH
jgi:hypothetical protein